MDLFSLKMGSKVKREGHLLMHRKIEGGGERDKYKEISTN